MRYYKKSFLSVLLSGTLFSSLMLPSAAIAKEINFEIAPGTADELLDWNDKENPLVADVGDVLIVTNLDSEPHQLHTDGRPCGHGDRIEPNGGTWSCVLEKPYNALLEESPTRDHYNYDLGFWIIVK